MVLALALHWKVAPGNKVIGGINGANTFGGEELQVAVPGERLPQVVYVGMGKHPGALKQILQPALIIDRVMETVRGSNRDQAFVGSGQLLRYDHRMFVPVLIPTLGTEIPVRFVPDFHKRVAFGGQEYGIAKAHLAAHHGGQV